MRSDVAVRPLTDADVEPARLVARAALDGVETRFDAHPDVTEPSPADVDRGRARIRRCLATDPEGSWVAEQAGDVVGVALAIRRGPLWFLSLLAVAEGLQGQGVGARLMDAALTTSVGATGGLITCSRDPRALRRYQLAGFRLEPAFTAKGVPDLSLRPPGSPVRPGDLGPDRGLLDAVAIAQRGASHGTDLDAMIAAGARLLVVDEGEGAGFAVVRGAHLAVLGATTEPVAQQLLWAALAAVGEQSVTVDWITARQQWALSVGLAARLSLWCYGPIAVREDPGPLLPYLPSGVWG